MAFLSGAFGGRDYPAVLQAVANVLPLRYFIDLVRAAYLEDKGLWNDPRALAVLGAWGLGERSSAPSTSAGSRRPDSRDVDILGAHTIAGWQRHH